MKYIKTLNCLNLKKSAVKGGCGECQSSCQSACKTDDGTINQDCKQEEICNIFYRKSKWRPNQNAHKFSSKHAGVRR